MAPTFKASSAQYPDSGTTSPTFFPDVPTIAESGVPGYETYTWNALFAPANTPPEVVAAYLSSLAAGGAAFSTIGRKAAAIPGDLTDPAFCRDLVDRALAELGGYFALPHAHGREWQPLPRLFDDAVLRGHVTATRDAIAGAAGCPGCCCPAAGYCSVAGSA